MSTWGRSAFSRLTWPETADLVAWEGSTDPDPAMREWLDAQHLEACKREIETLDRVAEALRARLTDVQIPFEGVSA